MIPIGGFIHFSGVDYPGKLAAVIFCQGCPWRCAYCHNPHLQPISKKSGPFRFRELLEFFKRRAGLLDAVVFSGGEPTLHRNLPEAVGIVKDLGFSIGLHTSGIYPDSLARTLPLIDWVGMDIKAPFDKYHLITHQKNSGEAAKKSARLILKSSVAYEFRTTVHPALLSEEDLLKITGDLREMGASRYAIQHVRKQGCVNPMLNQNPCRIPFSASFLKSTAGQFEEFSVR